MQVSELIERWSSADGAGFDLSAERSLDVANRAIRRFAAKARNLEGQISIGPTVADQAAYTLEDRILDLKGVIVGGEPYGRASQRDYFDLVAGIGSTAGFPGAFAPSFDDEAGSLVALYPTPEEDGTEILGLAILAPQTLTVDSQVPFQEDSEAALLHEMTAIGYETIDENPDMAAYHHARADSDAIDLGNRHRSRVGSGPVKLGFLGRR